MGIQFIRSGKRRPRSYFILFNLKYLPQDFFMKKTIVFASLLFCCLTLRGQLADLVELPEEMKNDSLAEDELLKTWGWLLAQRFNLSDYDFSAAEIHHIFSGMDGFIQGEEPPTNLKTSMSQIQGYFTRREEATLGRQLAENKEKEIEFFEGLFGLPEVQMLGTGLYYKILDPGTGPHPKLSDSVVVHYEGRFLDNTIFDSSNGKSPAAFKLGNVIDGWKQGLKLIGAGGKIKLFVPSKLGYGERAMPRVPPGSTLIFDISLLKIGLPETLASPEAEEGTGVK